MNLTFLIGAGVSIPAGLPCTAKLTEELLSAHRYHMHTDGQTVEPEHSDLIQSADLDTVSVLIRTIYCKVEEYFRSFEPKRQANYEDLFFVVNQLVEHLTGEYENPVIETVVDDLLLKLRSAEVSLDREALGEQLVRAQAFGQGLLRRKLATRESDPCQHLSCMIGAIGDSSNGHAHIVTLNHDTLIERALLASRVSFVDGFNNGDRFRQYWDGRMLRNAVESPTAPLLLKLHGSIDWHDYRPDDGRSTLARRRTIEGPIPGNDDFGERHEYPQDCFLVGTFDKIRNYSHEPYFTLFLAFIRLLDRTDTLVVSGYSFGDKRINQELNRWLCDNRARRLILLHEDPQSCWDAARLLMQRVRNSPTYKTQFVDIPRFLTGYSWPELKRSIDQHM